MEEGQDKPKIKLKVRQTDESSSQISSEQSPQPVQKIKLHEKSEDIVQNDAASYKKRSIFHVTAIILTALLVVAIFVEIAVMLWLRAGTDDLKNKNSKLPPAETTCLICEMNDLDNEFLIDKI